MLTESQRIARDILEWHHDMTRAAAYQLVRTLTDDEVEHLTAIERDATRAMHAVLDFAAERRQQDASVVIAAEQAVVTTALDGGTNAAVADPGWSREAQGQYNAAASGEAE